MKILIAVMSCEARRDYVQQQRINWFPEVKGRADVRVFTGRGTLALDRDVVQVDAPDDYAGIIYKFLGLLKWAQDRDYDYVFKVDDDVLLIPDRLFKSNFLQHDYYGGVLWTPSDALPFLSGCCLGFSRKAIAIALSAPVPKPIADDLWFGEIMVENGIVPFSDPNITIALPANRFLFFKNIIAAVDHRGGNGAPYGERLGINLYDLKSRLGLG